MNLEQAKEILLLCRLGAADDDDPLVAQALDFANQDEELRRWLDAHLAAQEKLRHQFRMLPVPEGLREQILSEAPQMAPARSFSVKRVVAVCAVAGVLWLASVAGFNLVSKQWQQYQARRFDRFTQGMVHAAANGYYMDLVETNLASIRAFLVMRGIPDNYSMPAGFASATPTGCVASQWQGRPVAMICFRTPGRDAAQTSDLWFFAAPRGFLRGEPADGAVQYSTFDGLAAAGWTTPHAVYLVGLRGELAQLKNLVQ